MGEEHGKKRILHNGPVGHYSWPQILFDRPGPGPRLFGKKTHDSLTYKSVSYSLCKYDIFTTEMISFILEKQTNLEHVLEYVNMVIKY